MNAQPQWDDLQVFLAAARGGGLSSAARALGVNHATVSRRLARLEGDLQVRLFDRSPQGLALTAAGEELVGHARAIESEVGAIRRKVAGRDQRLEGTVRLSTVGDVAEILLPPMLSAFHREHPAVTVAVDVGQDFASLARMQADIAIRLGTPPAEAGSVRRRLGTVGMRLYASPSYLAAHGRPTNAGELADHWTVRGPAEMANLGSEAWLERFTRPDRIRVRCGSMQVRIAAVRQGIGIGMLSTFTVARAGGLVCLPLDGAEFTTGIWLGMHGEVRKAARVRAVADHLYAGFEAVQDQLHPPLSSAR